jgi:hypothetical protein
MRAACADLGAKPLSKTARFRGAVQKGQRRGESSLRSLRPLGKNTAPNANAHPFKEIGDSP